MRSIGFHDGSLVAWKDEKFLDLVLSSGSYKMRILKFLIKTRLLFWWERRVGSALNFDNFSFDACDLISLDLSFGPVKLNSYFMNCRKRNPRLYVWASNENCDLFVKIGSEVEFDSFEREYAAAKCVFEKSDIKTPRPLLLKKIADKKIVCLVFESISLVNYVKRKTIDPMALIARLLENDGHGIFCGYCHGDLTRGNLFLINELIWVIDWEMGGVGPEYTDAISVLLSFDDGEWSVAKIREFFLLRFSLVLSAEQVDKCLRYLNGVGHEKARHIN